MEAMTLADILVVMNGGQVEQIGKPLDIYKKPATTFVASFIGAPPMNLLSIKANDLGGLLDALPVRAPGDAILGIRPEDFALVGTAAPQRLILELVVDAIERVGAETFVYGTRSRDGDGPTVSARPGELPPGEIIVRLPGEAAPAVGDRIKVSAAPDKLHLFSADGRSRVGD
jgi:sn-glycerol 3-phosphate transport system ATP-binding protein